MRVDLQKIKSGMKLSEPVLNQQGGLLLKEGEVITPQHLMLFKTWGVGQFEVEGESKKEEGTKKGEEIEKEVEAIFSASGGGEIMEEIKRVAKKMRAAKERSSQ